ncbi:MAG: energy transducer TonB [Acidobacteriaceae bacterium]|nr:energy transducer TonB [Acidobacteriaceae bacterium]MBV9499499.1 energy transducer TonB [Acidobacteriaceae bacterium]
MHRVGLGLMLLSLSIQAHFDQTLTDLTTQESVYRSKMLWDKDAETLREIIAVWSSGMGHRSVGIAQYYSKLGAALMHTGDYAAGEQALRSALSILEANGPLYQEAATVVKRRLVKALLEQNKTEEAKELQNSLPPLYPKLKNDSEPQLISKEEPQYTRAAASRDVGGTILVSLTVDETGHARDIHVIEPLGFGLDASAIEAVKKWRFKPAIRGGAPVSSEAAVELSFRHP